MASKDKNTKKSTEKKPAQRTLKEKRQAKRAKEVIAAQQLLGSVRLFERVPDARWVPPLPVPEVAEEVFHLWQPEP